MRKREKFTTKKADVIRNICFLEERHRDVLSCYLYLRGVFNFIFLGSGKNRYMKDYVL